jgi:hypothetical protein
MAVCLFVGFLAGLQSATLLGEFSSIGVNFTANSIHTHITIAQNGKTILSEYHAGAVTNLGKNLTLCKLTGVGTGGYNLTTYVMNLTYVSIGYNTSSLDQTITILPGEWNRTTASLHALTYNTFNMTAVFYPGTGPYSANCLGVNYASGIGTTVTLWGYDSFSLVTGIDQTFTITLEIIITVS